MAENVNQDALARELPIVALEAPTSSALGNGTIAGLVYDGLSATPKRLSSSLLYDAVGSALFDAICHLPEYECMRGEMRNLPHCARILTKRMPQSIEIVELGGGNGDKIAAVLPGMIERQTSIVFHNIDVSTTALSGCRQRLSAFPAVKTCAHACTFEEGLQHAAKEATADSTRLFLFLGSSIGNFDYQAATRLLKNIRLAARSGDLLLIGVDLIKPLERLLAAYDDPQGVTAAFNKNLLARINHDLGGDFAVHRFKHEARYNATIHAVEMHLVSLAEQRVTIPGAGMVLDFKCGETILTEQCHKYTARHIVPWLEMVGFQLLEMLIDERSQFADVIARVV